VDTFIDRLQRDLAAYEPTLVFHSDHGEAFGEHGTFGHEPYVYEENIRVPFLVANGDPSGTVSRPVSLRSIPALIASLAGVESSFPNLGVVEQEPADDIVMSNPLGNRTAMRSRRLKFIRNSDEGRDEMYDLAVDHDERCNLLGERSELADTCRAWLRGRQDHETEELELLRAIGNMIEREEL
jgi:arylsulfatase